MHGAVKIASGTEAGTAAAHLAGLLRAGPGAHATVSFTNGRGVLKAIRVLTIANEFLNQHRSALSFTPTALKRLVPQRQQGQQASLPSQSQQPKGRTWPPTKNAVSQLFVIDAWSRPSQYREIR